MSQHFAEFSVLHGPDDSALLRVNNVSSNMWQKCTDRGQISNYLFSPNNVPGVIFCHCSWHVTSTFCLCRSAAFKIRQPHARRQIAGGGVRNFFVSLKPVEEFLHIFAVYRKYLRRANPILRHKNLVGSYFKVINWNMISFSIYLGLASSLWIHLATRSGACLAKRREYVDPYKAQQPINNRAMQSL